MSQKTSSTRLFGLSLIPPENDVLQPPTLDHSNHRDRWLDHRNADQLEIVVFRGAPLPPSPGLLRPDIEHLDGAHIDRRTLD